MGRSLGVALALLIGCDSESAPPSRQPVEYAIGQTSYVIPREHIERMTAPDNPEGAIPFIVLRPDGERYILVWDALSSRRVKEAPPGSFVVGRINDVGGRRVLIRTVGKQTIACIPHQPHRNCGTNLRDGEVTWSLIFDERRETELPELVAQATRSLARYWKALP